ncbi:MAG: hypothetical protein GC162_05890 [Planctomycetes bacterium]|nr:hypothetical protein [Planctomycetota bacterium]
MSNDPWARWRVPAIEWFVLLNLAVLAADIRIAHSVNRFADRAEWAPLAFSIAGSVLLAGAMIGGGRVGAALKYLIAWSAVAVGLTGMMLHLESQFFARMTLKSLVYSAPFVAPLAYTGLGLLLLMVRMVDERREQWGRWIVFLAMAGFVGNFALGLLDHAQNGFFRRAEWIPVISAAFAVGFLLVAVVAPARREYLRICLLVMAAQIAVGLVGAALHLWAIRIGPAGSLWDNIVFGPPPLAPMLFANLALLAAAGLFDLDRYHTATSPLAPDATPV